MAEKKAEKTPSEVATAYMLVLSKERAGDLRLYEVFRIERVDGKLREERVASIPPLQRSAARERLQILNAGRDVLP